MLFELKTIRKKSGLSQEDAADQLGVPIGTYRNWEQLKTMPRDRGDIPRLARFFGVTVEDLFGEDFVVPGTCCTAWPRRWRATRPTPAGSSPAVFD